jgi:hypothetical protein
LNIGLGVVVLGGTRKSCNVNREPKSYIVQKLLVGDLYIHLKYQFPIAATLARKLPTTVNARIGEMMYEI